MEISIPVVRLLFLALPGLVADRLYKKLRGRPRKRPWEDLVGILIFSLGSYLVLAALSFVYCKCVGQIAPDCGPIAVLSAALDGKMPVDWLAVAFATGIGAVLAFCGSYAHKTSLVLRFARFIRASNRTGDEQLWELFLNDPKTEAWLFVRDHKLALIYYGCVTHYSESHKERELVMEDVSVHHVDGDLLYRTPALYVSREPFDLSIELVPPDPICTPKE